MKTSNHKSQKGIIALTVVLSIGLFGLVAVLTVTNGILSEFSKNNNSKFGDRAFYTADGAVREGTQRFLSAYQADPVYYHDFAGQYTTNYTLASLAANDANLNPVEISGTWPNYEIRAYSNNARTQRITTQQITVYSAGLALDYAVFANETLGLSGNTTVNGNIFTNDDIDFQGNSSEVNGNAAAVGNIDDPDNISGTVSEGVTPISPPPIDLLPYSTQANLDGTYFNNTAQARAYLNNRTRNSEVYLDSPNQLNLSANTNLTGSLIVLGGLRLTGGNYTVGDLDEDVAIYVKGDLFVAGGTRINGVVYVEGTTTFGAGNNVINGSLISVGGVVDLSGNTTVNFDPNYIPELSPLVGGEYLTNPYDPRLLLWKEL